MNTPYFACLSCRIYIESGYRWAYWQLEHPGVVQHNEGVNVEAVLACTEYWSPPEQERSDWLCERVLPAVRRFLNDHREHGIVYTDQDVIYNEESLYYGWSEIEI
jgi:hypothetical protein